MSVRTAPTALAEDSTRTSDVILDVLEKCQGLSLESIQKSSETVKSLPRSHATGGFDWKNLRALVGFGEDVLAAVVHAEYSLVDGLIKAQTSDSAA